MIKIALMNILSKKIYIRAFLNSLFLGILFFLVAFSVFFTNNIKKKIIGDNYSKNYGELFIGNDSLELSVDVERIEKNTFVEDVVYFYDYSTGIADFKVVINNKELNISTFECFKFDDNCKIVSKNVEKEYGDILLNGRYPKNENESLVNESFLKSLDLDVNDVIGKTIFFYTPNNKHLSVEYRNDLYLSTTVVGVISDKLFENDSFLNDPVIVTNSSIQEKPYYFVTKKYKAYYNTFDNVESFYEIIKEETGLDFYHNKDVDFAFANYLKKYVGAFVSVVYVFLLFMILSISLLLAIDYYFIEKRNSNLNFIMKCYGAGRNKISFRSFAEKMALFIISTIFTIIISFLMAITINLLLHNMFNVSFKLSINEIIILNIPSFIMQFVVIIIISLVLSKKNEKRIINYIRW